MRTYRESARAAAGGSRESYAPRGGRQQAANRGPALVALQRALGNQAVAQLVQMKLRMGRPGDAYEREADNVADRVLRMPAASVQRKCAECEAEEEGRVMRSAPGAAAPVNMSPETEAGIRSIRGGGTPMPESLRSYFEPRFGQDFGSVRLHTDGRAGGLAQSIGARAFTVGGDIAFAPGQYAPESTEGKRLIAHELTHVVQQGYGGEQAVQRQSAPSTVVGPMVQRDADDDVMNGVDVDDPNVLVCLILCYLGIPTPVWKRLVGTILKVVWEEYRAAHTQEEAEKKFQAYQMMFKAYSPINLIKTVLVFAVEGKIAHLPVIKTAIGKRLQTQLVEFMIAKGATMATIGAAEQIARKVTLAIELAIIAGCAAMCGGEAGGKKLAEWIDSTVAGIAEGIQTASEIASSFGNAIATELVTRPLYTAKAMVDPTNWVFSDNVLDQTRVDIRVLGLYLWSKMEVEQPEAFVRNVNRPLSSYSIPSSIINAIASGTSSAYLLSSGGPLVFKPELINGLSPLTFVQLLKDKKLLTFKQSPEAIAEAAIAAQNK